MKEADIRPQALFNQYLTIAQKDIEKFFSDRSDFVDVNCPACASTNAEIGLEKFGFRYLLCNECETLYMSPRPTSVQIDTYYRESEAVKFWGTHFFKETADARRAKMFAPRALLVKEWVGKELSSSDSVVVDVGSGYGIFLEELQKLKIFDKIIGIEPAPNLASICQDKGFHIFEKPVEEVGEDNLAASFVTIFEVLEHVYEPSVFLTAIKDILQPGGVLLFTTLTVSGFDIQTLWDHSKSIYPPHHVNLISVDGMRTLMSKCGFELLEISTPGKLDVDIIRNIKAENPAIRTSRFVDRLIKEDNKILAENFQRFLQANNLSSHIQVVARKPY